MFDEGPVTPLISAVGKKEFNSLTRIKLARDPPQVPSLVLSYFHVVSVHLKIKSLKSKMSPPVGLLMRDERGLQRPVLAARVAAEREKKKHLCLQITDCISKRVHSQRNTSGHRQKDDL